MKTRKISDETCVIFKFYMPTNRLLAGEIINANNPVNIWKYLSNINSHTKPHPPLPAYVQRTEWEVHRRGRPADSPSRPTAARARGNTGVYCGKA